MAATWISSIGFALLLLLCLSASARAAPSVSDLEQLGELERTLKELATSVLAMNGGFAGGADVNAGDVENDLELDTDSSAILEYLNKLSL
ncbi:hypothetical protein AWZ03_014186 [Drosophila navojoa]|uniref:Uncharacterized protein n=1 Tax=Drosophila navojoa TaxID=7232 RepID=A0A484ATL1_DRONA|nr:uncharacterized protein LOC115565195 isoform X2 [Drosophila navojoa]TDG39392.1 hypothetical protein AWZ03_014186 [Drosophila navojoa]